MCDVHASVLGVNPFNLSHPYIFSKIGCKVVFLAQTPAFSSDEADVLKVLQLFSSFIFPSRCISS